MASEAPCSGLWELFDSTDPRDHATAAAICEDCPILTACEERLAVARRSAHHELIHYGPAGTWAGRLIGGDGRNPYRLAAEEHMFTEDELRRAHRSYQGGDRTPRNEMGERVYQRVRARIKRERERKAVA